MNDTMDSAPAGEPVEKESFSNRKLIRPTLPRTDHNHGNHNSTQLQARERTERHDRPLHDRPLHRRNNICAPRLREFYGMAIKTAGWK